MMSTAWWPSSWNWRSFRSGDRVAEVDVEPGRVDAVLDAQRLAGRAAAFELLDEFVPRLDLLDAAADDGELLLDGGCIGPDVRVADSGRRHAGYAGSLT